ncbi:hypothetical protein [Mycolicibacter kumamotonensis]|nr:hypothetical protein [Mycolicibacter kumamotonensis]
MNVISYVNGDTKITDFPACSARPLARMVQIANDRLAGADGFLSPEDSVRVLDLGWRTVGTAGADDSVLWRWLHDLLVDPGHGVIRHADKRGREAIGRVAALLARKANGEDVDFTVANAAAYAAYAAVDAANAAAYAAYAAAANTNAAYAAVDAANAAAYAANAAAANTNAAYAAYAANAAAVANAAVVDAAVVDLADWAVTRWRELQGLDAKPVDIEAAALNDAFSRIGATA